MAKDEERLRSILQHNIGFNEPGVWLDYARRNSFKPVVAVKVPRCPDCSAVPSKRTWGQYVYYSTLIHLLECEGCGLVWADAHIDSEIIRQHFEVGYKSDEYFRESRDAVFEHFASVLDHLTRRDARILDVGGARGDLMAKVVARRPDVIATVHDVSKAATDWAAEHFGFSTLTGDANQLVSHSEQYDVVVLSDVLYYEPNLAVLWRALSRLVRPGGSVVIRIPNRALLIRLSQLCLRLTHSRAKRALQDRVTFYNPEHIFIFRKRYLRHRLTSIGFNRVYGLPSPLLASGRSRRSRAIFFEFAAIANQLLPLSPVLTPSMLVIGTGLEENRP